MERFDFITKDFTAQDLLDRGEDRALGAFFLVQELIKQEETFTMAMVALESDRTGMSVPEYCQYFYDNFSTQKIAMLGQILMEPDKIRVEKKSYETQEEFDAMVNETQLGKENG